MSLVEDVVRALDSDFHPTEIADAIPDLELVEDEYQDSSRWYEYWRAVYKRTLTEGNVSLDEYVAVDYSVPATEYQEVEQPYDDVYVVKAREITKVVYEKE